MVLLWGGASIALLWFLEYWAGPEISVSIFFIIPIALVVWRDGGRWAVLMPMVCAIAWITAELAAGRAYSHWEIGFWNALIRLAFFLIFAKLITMRRYYVLERSARETAEEASHLKSNMISLVSHEYNNALTNMKLAVALLQGAESKPVAQFKQDSYDILDRAIEHMRISTTTFLELNRLESGQFILNIRPTLLRSVASETLRFLQPIIKGKHLRLKVDFPPRPVPVRADPEALSIVMSNLITNAVKYTDAGVITVRIALEDGEPAQVLFSVADTGIGISAQDKDRIVSGFRTLEGRKTAKGFGVGLKVVKELIESHGSRLEIESHPGQGSRFYFHLPLWQEPKSAATPKPLQTVGAQR